MIIYCNRNDIVDLLFSKHSLKTSKTWLISTPNELIDAILSFDQTGQSSSPSSLLQARKINFLACKHLNNFPSSTTYCTNIYRPKLIRTISSGASPWPEVAQTIKSSVINTTFFQYWGISFTDGCPSWYKPVISWGNWVIFTRDTISLINSKQTKLACNLPRFTSIPWQEKGIQAPKTCFLPEPC